MLASLRDDADAHSWLRTAMASSFSPVECMKIELLCCSVALERQAMLQRICSDGCETNDMTWLVALSPLKSKDEYERVVRHEMSYTQ